MHDISSCSMYELPTVGRPSKRETSFRVSSRQEMRSLSPGRGTPLRTSARNAKLSKGSVADAYTLPSMSYYQKRIRCRTTHSATFVRFGARSCVSLGLGRSPVTSWMSNCAPLKSFARSETQYGFWRGDQYYDNRRKNVRSHSIR
jgi:hypothetical protein